MARKEQGDYSFSSNIYGGFEPIMLRHDYDEALFNSLSQYAEISNRKNREGREAKSRVLKALQDIPLHESEDQYRKDLSDKIAGNIEKSAKYGHYQDAYDTAMDMIDFVTTDPELNNKSRYFTQWTEAKNNVDTRNDIDADTKAWWHHNHPYNFAPKKDADGNVIEWPSFRAEEEMPVKNIDWEQVAKISFEFASPNKSGSSKESSSFVDGTGGRTKTGSSVQKVTEQQIRDNIQQYIRNNYREVAQRWEVDNYNYEKLKKQLENTSLSDIDRDRINQQLQFQEKYLWRNGSKDLESYVYNQIKKTDYAKNMAYKFTESESVNDKQVVTDKEGSKSKGNDDDSGKKPNGYGYGPYNPESVPGASRTVPSSGNGTGNIIYRTNDRFGY